MKITLEFNEEDEFRARCAFHGFSLWSALHEVDQQCRSRMKHGEDVSEAEYASLEELRELCQIASFIEEEL